MDAFLDLLITWGPLGLFIAAILAGSVVPFSSELVLLGLIQAGADPIVSLVAATLGNTVGGMTCYFMGRLGNIEWIEKHTKIKKEKIDKMQTWLQGKGALMAFFCFLPILGSIIGVALGFMRSNMVITCLSMALGKLIRYIICILAMYGIINAFFI